MIFEFFANGIDFSRVLTFMDIDKISSEKLMVWIVFLPIISANFGK